MIKDCEAAVRLARKLEASPISRKELEDLIGGPLPALVSACANCGEPRSEAGFTKIIYLLITNGQLEQRAQKAPFAGVVQVGNVRYTAIARCRYCDCSAPILTEV